MYACCEYIACMKRSETDQYTIRGVPKVVGIKLHEKARREEKSLNKVAVETLLRGLGLAGIVYVMEISTPLPDLD